MAATVVRRKLSVLHAAILSHGGHKQQFDPSAGLVCHRAVTRATCSEEFVRYREALEAAKTASLTATQLARAFEAQGGLYYDRLTHGFAVSRLRQSTAAGEEPSRVALQRAQRADDAEMVCFLRFLDHDGDGLISKADFCDAVLSGDLDAIPTLGKKWVALQNLRKIERILYVPPELPGAVGGRGMA